MKLQIVSDLHIEFDKSPVLGGKRFTLPVTDADAIVLAGDIGVGFDQERNFCEELTQVHQKDVVFILGNHSFYGKGNIDKIRDQWAEVDISGVHYLDEGKSWIKDGTLFVGGILWTNFNRFNQASMDSAAYHMNDYYHSRMYKQDSTSFPRWPIKNGAMRRKQVGGRSEYQLTPRRTADEHTKTLQWMQKVIESDKVSTKRVVVSHHLPSARSVSLRYSGGGPSGLNAAYYSDLDGWIYQQKFIDLWVHGHTHDNQDYELDNGTHVVCNPRGYHGYEENNNFINNLVIEV